MAHNGPVTPPASGAATPTASSLAATQMAKSAAEATAPSVASLDASKLRIKLTGDPRPVPAIDGPEYAASNVCTDHMITCSWRQETGWAAPELRPYGPLSLMPTASVLHYATECFEGLKLYRGFDGALRLFRVDRNCARMVRSATRIALPAFDGAELQKLIVELCALEGPKWLPRATHQGRFLYLRPTLISDDPTLGVQRPKQALLFVILTLLPDMSNPNALSPSPTTLPSSSSPSSDSDIKGLRLLASREDTIRAWPGGFGFAKLGANYGPSLLAQGEARARGFHQILWLFGSEAFVTEAGASNFFIVWRDAHTGQRQLVTAPLDEGVILEGVTRASILSLAKERLARDDELHVVERRYTMREIETAVTEGRLEEAFAAGTAFFVAPVGLIEWQGRALRVPTTQDGSGKYAALLRGWLSDVMYGKVEHEWGLVVEEKEQAL